MCREEAVSEGPVGFRQLLPPDRRSLLHFVLNEMERFFFHFLWKGRGSLIRRSICSQQPLDGELGMTWLMMRRHARQHFLKGEQL